MASNHTFTHKEGSPDTLIVFGICPVTLKSWTLEVPVGAYFAWLERGMVIQKAFPSLNADDRELLISGVSKEGWEQLFGNEDHEEGRGLDENPRMVDDRSRIERSLDEADDQHHLTEDELEDGIEY